MGQAESNDILPPGLEIRRWSSPDDDKSVPTRTIHHHTLGSSNVVPADPVWCRFSLRHTQTHQHFTCIYHQHKDT